MQVLERPGILFWQFPELESPGKLMQVLESPVILFWHFSRTGKSWKINAGPGKSWNFILAFFQDWKDLEN